MKIKSISLKNIKSFSDKVSIEFGESSVNAFSGVNGAGKSTLLKMIWLIQKAHYLLQPYSDNDTSVLQGELSRYLAKNDSYFSLTVDFEGNELELKLARTKSSSEVELIYSDEELANRMWNRKSPKNLILFVDASKEFSEDTLAFDEIDIAGNDATSLLISAITTPNKLFSGIYRQLVKDWAHERLIPGADRLFYYQVAGRLFNLLIPKVVLSNFSGSFKPREFVLLGKSLQSAHSSTYDVREFSSGEKALLSTLTFLCLSKSVSVFLIDEPENHFHESLLLKFISLLDELCQPDGFVKVVSKIPDPKRSASVKKGKDGAETGALRYLDEALLTRFYGGTALSQVVVSTHSKSLIYKIFTLGQNYLVEKTVDKLEYKDAESTLRGIGLSTTFSKVLLVEGTGDNEALESLFIGENITIKALDGSDAVIESFKRLAALESHISESKFIFIVDSDNKPDDYFKKLEKINPNFYKKSFIALPAHELENLFLDSKIIRNIIVEYAKLVGGDVTKFNDKYIQSVIKDCAAKSLPTVYKKEISLIFTHMVERHFANIFWGNKKFKWDDFAQVENQIKAELNLQANQALNDLLTAESKAVFLRYNAIKDDDLIQRCDGKQTLGTVCHRLGQETNMGAGELKKALYKHAREDKNSAIGKLVAEIMERLK